MENVSQFTRSEPIAIEQSNHYRTRPVNFGSLSGSLRTPRQRHDTISRIKESFGGSLKNGVNSSPHLSSPTPPTFVPDGSHKASKIGDYLLVEQVEGHNNGNVFRAVNTVTEFEFICKVYKQDDWRRTVEPYSRIEPHPNINCIVDIVHGPTSTYLFFQPGMPQETNPMEKVDSKSDCFKADNLHNLTRTQKCLSEKDAAHLFIQVARTVEHCHKNNIVLRDLKLRKFIFRDLDRKQIMLESLEGAHVLESENEEGIAVSHGCPAYISPEIISAAALSAGGQAGNKVNGSLAKTSDIWSMGVMLYTMLLGRYPFEESQPSALFSKIRGGKFIIPGDLSFDARDLIHNLLRRDPSQRFRASDVLEHPWIKRHGLSWDTPRVIMPIGCGGNARNPQAGLSSFHTVPSSRDTLSSFAWHYVDQVVPDSYVSAEDETMFE